MNIVVKVIWQIFTMVEILETPKSFQDTKIVFAIIATRREGNLHKINKCSTKL